LSALLAKTLSLAIPVAKPMTSECLFQIQVVVSAKMGTSKISRKYASSATTIAPLVQPQMCV